MPFGLSCLASADPASLIELAEHHEPSAAKRRVLAKASDPTKWPQLHDRQHSVALQTEEFRHPVGFWLTAGLSHVIYHLT
jgi:hypothetical protein